MVEVIIPPTMGAVIGFITSDASFLQNRNQAGENGAHGHQLWPDALNRPLDISPQFHFQLTANVKCVWNAAPRQLPRDKAPATP